MTNIEDSVPDEIHRRIVGFVRFAIADRLGLEPVVNIVDPRRAAPDRQIANPVSYSKTPATYRSAPPGVGEDNEAVLAWLRTGAR